MQCTNSIKMFFVYGSAVFAGNSIFIQAVGFTIHPSVHLWYECCELLDGYTLEFISIQYDIRM